MYSQWRNSKDSMITIKKLFGISFFIQFLKLKFLNKEPKFEFDRPVNTRCSDGEHRSSYC